LWRYWRLRGCRSWRWLSTVEAMAVVAEVFTAVVAEVFTVEAVAGFTAVEVFQGEAAHLAGSAVADLTEVAASMEAAGVLDGVAGALAGAAEVGADEAGVGAGDLVSAGRIGDMVGAIRTATTATIRAITRHTLTLIRILPMDTQKTT
jgi:hypothetical protein